MEKPRKPGAGRHPSARHRRLMIALLTPEGPTYLLVPDPRTRSRIAKHANAVDRYLVTGVTRGLRRFAGAHVVLVDGSRLDFVTDLGTIDRLAEGGELHYELYRR
jgi:hypothetical protein